MSSLKQRLIDVVQRIGDEFSSIRSQYGQNSNLTTTDKTTLVDAINEINDKIINTQIINVSSPAGTWTLSHTLGRLPSVDVYLQSGEKILTDVITSNTQVVITFSQPTTGYVVLF